MGSAHSRRIGVGQKRASLNVKANLVLASRMVMFSVLALDSGSDSLLKEVVVPCR